MTTTLATETETTVPYWTEVSTRRKEFISHVVATGKGIDDGEELELIGIEDCLAHVMVLSHSYLTANEFDLWLYNSDDRRIPLRLIGQHEVDALLLSLLRQCIAAGVTKRFPISRPIEEIINSARALAAAMACDARDVVADNRVRALVADYYALRQGRDNDEF